jgi:purine-binding chemotaxis protein CheW
MFQGEMMTMGVLADSVSQVMDLAADEIEPTPPFGTRVKTEYLLGMGALGKKFCLILDIERVLSADELLAMTESVTDDAAIGCRSKAASAFAKHAEAGA